MRRIGFALMLVATGIGGAYAAEGDVTVVGGLDIGFRKVELNAGEKGERRRLSTSYVMISPNIALAVNAFYAALSYDKSIYARPTVTRAGDGGGEFQEFSRSDTTATLGYRLNESFSAFAGYVEATNDVWGGEAEGGELNLQRFIFAEKGPFAGIAYSKAFGDKGTLGLSIAYAKLDAELTGKDYSPANEPDSVIEGDATGFSYGLTWSGPLAGSLGYRIGVKTTRYRLEEDEFRVNEDYVNYFLGISGYF